MQGPDTNPFSNLTISNGTTTLNLIDTTNTGFCIVDGSWLPAVASMRKATLGNQGIHDDVVEDMELYVYGGTPAAMRANVEALAGMMNQAYQYWRGDNDVAPVILTMRLKSSAVVATGYLSAFIVGPVGNAIEFVGNWNALASTKRARVRIRFTRRGALVGGDQSWTSSPITSPGEISFGYSSGQYWRSKLSVSGFNTGASGSTVTLPSGYIITSDAHIAAIEAESGGIGISHTDPGFITVSGASGGTVYLVYNEQMNFYDIPASIVNAGQRFAVFGLMRRGESDSNSWTIRIGAVPSLLPSSSADILPSDYVATTVIGPSTTNAWYALGSFTANNGGKMLVYYQTNDPTYLAQTMLVDMFVLVPIDRPGTNIVLIEKQTLPTGFNYTMLIDPGTFVRAPSILFTDGTRTTSARWRGNLISESKGPLFFRYLACNSNASAGIVMNGTTVALTIAATQNQLYLGPQ